MGPERLTDVMNEASRSSVRASVTEMLSSVALNVLLLTLIGPEALRRRPECSHAPRRLHGPLAGMEERTGKGKAREVDGALEGSYRAEGIADRFEGGKPLREVLQEDHRPPEESSSNGVFSQLILPERSESDERPPARESPFISRLFPPVDRNDRLPIPLPSGRSYP